MIKMGKKSQRKGADGEREVVEILTAEGYNVKRGTPLNFGNEPDVYGLPGVHIEVKRAERLNLLDAVKQSQRDAIRFDDGEPAVFHRKNRSEWLVTMPLASWIKIYKAKK